jgi:hypothetical protein
MHKLSYDPELALLEYDLTGYWSIEEFRRFEAELRAFHVQIRGDRTSYRVLANARDFAVQSAEVRTAFEALFEALSRENAGPFAVVVSSALNSIQAKRALPLARVRTFNDDGEARHWLLADNSLPE